MCPMGGADLRFHSPQPDTSKTMDTGLVHCMVCVYFPAEASHHFTDPGDGRLSGPSGGVNVPVIYLFPRVMCYTDSVDIGVVRW